MKVFKHSGDIGDIIYSLPIIREMGGGVLLLSIEDNFKYFETKFNRVAFNALVPLLESQEYITEVSEFKGQKFDIDLDLFRFEERPKVGMNLGVWSARWHGLGEEIFNEPWLTVDGWNNGYKLFNYTPRYQNNGVNVKELCKDSVFIGIEMEWRIFKNQFKIDIPFYGTKNLYEAACLIDGSQLFIGNQSSLFAIAVGLGVDAELIVSHKAPNCHFKRENIVYHV